MVIHFQLNYLTQWGEHIAVEIDGNANNPVVLSTEDGKQWETTVKLPHRHAGELVTYRYSVWRGTQRVRQERGAQRHIITQKAKSKPPILRLTIGATFHNIMLSSHLPFLVTLEQNILLALH